MNSFEIFLEIGQKKVFAVSAHWPGWARAGRDELTAIQSLWDSASRYAKALSSSGLQFLPPKSLSDFSISGRLEGNITTDFGAPDAFFPHDAEAIEIFELERSKKTLDSCWKALDQAMLAAQGKELKRGPRGGGRDLDKIIQHVVEAEEGYLKVFGYKPAKLDTPSIDERKSHLREEAFKGLELAFSGQISKVGPKGGKRWPPKFYIRRLAWHALDHAWEIEDRILS
ncbi:MAG: hypothetical protein FJZ98_04465 [Chloroflexi bacterium]|nr:hypothetical protein [Chloroflexota bacterium]